jgi:hypothetical protein
MPDRANQSGVRIGRVHSAAICEEIGERLRTRLNRQAIPLPPELRTLIGQLRDVSHHEPGRMKISQKGLSPSDRIGARKNGDR